MFFTSLRNKNCPSGLQLATIPLTLLICALLITCTQQSSVADYDSDGGLNFGPSGDGGGGGSGSSGSFGAETGNDEVYETALLQQDMDEHAKRKKLMDDVEQEQEEEEDRMGMEMTTTVAAEMNNESMNTIKAQARIDNMMSDSQDDVIKIPLSMPPTAMPPPTGPDAINTLIPAYVRRPKAESFPRTIIGGTVSVEEADANISTSDYVEDEEEDEEQQQQQHMGTRAEKTNKIDAIAMKLYHQQNANAVDNTLKDQQPAPPQQQQQRPYAPAALPQVPLAPLAPQAPPRHNQLHTNNSDEDYYDDLEETSFENAQHLHQHHHRPSTPVAAAAPMPPTAAPAVSQPSQSTPTLRIGIAMIPNVNTLRAQQQPQPAVVGGAQARGGADTPTTNAPRSMAGAAVIPTTTTIPIYPNDNSFNAITPNIAAKSTTTTMNSAPAAAPAIATGLSLESITTTTDMPMTTHLPLLPQTAQPPTAPPTTTAATITTIRPTGKQGKQINLAARGRKLLPHEQLRNYIEDAYIRMPLAVIVDPSTDALEKTKALWREALRTNLNIKIVLVSLNASGIPAAYNFNNTRQFLAGLNSIKVNDGGNSFVGILHASELVPYDSAVFISTAAIPPHTELVQDAAITLLKKRIRLYLIWYGERSLSENETQEAVGGILGEVAIRSGGEVLHLVGSENSQELEGSTLTIVADAYVGTQEVDIPVDTTLSSLHVKIDAPMRTATLETPNGDINLKKLVKFKSLVLTHGPDDHRLDAYVPLNKLRKATVYKLRIVPESLSDEYGVFVRAERKSDLFLDDLIKHFDNFLMQNRGSYPLRLDEIRLNNLPDAINDKILNSQSTHSKLRFASEEMLNAETLISDSNKNDLTLKNEVETFSDTEIVHNNNQPLIPTNHTAQTPTAVVNINTKYNGMARAAAATSLLQRDVTKIEMGLQSQLLLAPGMLGTLQFELTNTRTEAIYHNIQVIDERRFLLRLNPQNIFLRAGEMATVAVTVLIPNGTPQGTIDKITFTCHGGGTSSLSLNLKVLSATAAIDAQDTTAPTVSWSFGSRCDNINSESSNCAERFWTLDITAQDWQTGIMRLQTIPPAGLIYRNSYTVGSTEPLKATYIATCCEPKVAITAFDVAANQRSYNVDVRDLVLTEASIAAIVLGALLLVLLIILVIWGIVWCCRRRQVSLDLPTYRSHSTRSME